MASASIIIPAHNEERAIASVIRGVKSLGRDLEIIVIDDGSTDRTGAIALAESVIVVRHSLRLGAGKSVKDGIERASSDHIVMMDADATYPANRIPDFLHKLDEGYDLVVGARFGKEYRGTLMKSAARVVFRLIAEFATGKCIPDINSGMRAFRRQAIRDYFPHLCNGFSLPTTMTLAYFFTGRMVTYMPIEYYKRIGESKVRIVVDSLRTLQYITESIMYFNPIKIFLILSAFSFVSGLIAVPFLGWAPAIFGFYTAIIVFAVGLVAESMRRPRR